MSAEDLLSQTEPVSDKPPFTHSTIDMDEFKRQREAHAAANEAVAHLVRDGWMLDQIGDVFTAPLAICPVCFAYCPNTNVAKVKHQEWHDSLGR